MFKISGSLWKYCKDIPAVNNNGDNGTNATDSFNFKEKITGHTDDDDDDDEEEINNVETTVPLK